MVKIYCLLECKYDNFCPMCLLETKLDVCNSQVPGEQRQQGLLKYLTKSWGSEVRIVVVGAFRTES